MLHNVAVSRDGPCVILRDHKFNDIIKKALSRECRNAGLTENRIVESCLSLPKISLASHIGSEEDQRTAWIHIPLLELHGYASECDLPRIVPCKL
jgi:hypothetical protein